MRPGFPRRYELNVKLLDTHPPVWRRLDVPADITFHGLHEALRIVMGWSDAQPHLFTAGKRRLGPPGGLDDPHLLNERKQRLGDLVRRPQTVFHYVYDPESEWAHEIFVERIDNAGAASQRVRCLDGKRAAPPEQLEGALAYQELLALLADPSDPEHEQVRQKIGADFEPDALDLERINRELARLG